MEIKEFWKKYGFEEVNHAVKSGWYWQYPGGKLRPDLPPIDLNNLFKYAVPKLSHLEIKTISLEGKRVWHVECSYGLKTHAIVEDDDLAKALYKAISEILE